MSKQKSLIGMEIDSSTHIIEAGQLKIIDKAIHQADPFIIDVSLEYPCFLLGNLIELPRIYRTLGLNIKNVLLSRESIIAHKTLNLGDSVLVKTFLSNAYEQQATSNPLGFIILESVGHVASDLIFISERILAIRGGFPRGART